MGASPRRIEDGSLIRGEGRYTTDVTPAGTLTAYVLRSTVAHARIKVGDLSAARAAPGVHLVWTAADVSDLGFMPCLAQGPDKTPIRDAALSGALRRHRPARRRRDRLHRRRRPEQRQVGGRADRRRLRDAAGDHRYGARRSTRTRRSSGRSAESNLAFEYEVGDKAATRCGLRQGGARSPSSRIVNNRARLQLHGAARDRRRIDAAERPLHRDRRLAGRARPARRPVQGAEGRSEDACACSPPTSAAASARRASTIANIRWR